MPLRLSLMSGRGVLLAAGMCSAAVHASVLAALAVLGSRTDPAKTGAYADRPPPEMVLFETVVVEECAAPPADPPAPVVTAKSDEVHESLPLWTAAPQPERESVRLPAVEYTGKKISAEHTRVVVRAIRHALRGRTTATGVAAGVAGEGVEHGADPTPAGSNRTATAPAPTQPTGAVAGVHGEQPYNGEGMPLPSASNKPPVYPAEAKRARQEGTVRLRLTVGPDGRVERVVVEQGSGWTLLDEAAKEAARGWTFVAAEGADLRRCEVAVPVAFSLKR